jgi:hypothetical protein
VTVYRQNQTPVVGRIVMVAVDGSVLWMMDGSGNGRTMILRHDKVEVYRTK